MPINAVNTQFSVATGGNVNSSSGFSSFDGPPSETTDLVIQPDASDPNPYQFNIGETVDVSYTSPSGDLVELDDAEVVRSDVGPSGTNVVVIRGTDADGNDVDIVWAPDYDLESWYDNVSAYGTPRFYVTDQQTATYGHVCLHSKTLIETDFGVRKIAALRRGDRVRTLDRGLQKICWIGARQVAGVGSAAPILFDPGAIGNHAPLRLSGQHRVLIAHPLAELYHGSSEVLVPAKSLVNGDSIRMAPCPQVTWMNLTTARHDLILAEGAPVETLWLGEVALNVLGEAGDIARNYPDLTSQGDATILAARPMLRRREAEALLALISGKPPVPVVARPDFAFL